MDQNTSDQVPMPGNDSEGSGGHGRSAMMKVLLFLIAIIVIALMTFFAVRAFNESDGGAGGVPTGPQISF